jgi:hypothetical protein
VIEHAAHDSGELALGRGGELLERLESAAAGPTHPAAKIGGGLLGAVGECQKFRV